jgi:hypothetical protein
MMSNFCPSDLPTMMRNNGITDYDRANFITYARILDALYDHVPWPMAAAEILGLDVAGDEANAHRIWCAHVDRAEWIVSDGLRFIIENRVISNQKFN